MGVPTRLPKGVTNVTAQAALGMFGALDPTKYISYFEDFNGPNVAFPIASSSLGTADATAWANWAIDVTEAGGGNATSAYTDANGGILTLTTDAADNDLIFVQGKPEVWLPTAGKKAWFKMKFSITDATADAATILNTEWYAGFMVTDTDPLSSTAGDGVTDGIFFMSEDGTQNIYLHCQKDATTGQLSTLLSATLTVATQTEFAFYFDGARYIEVFKDGAKINTVDLTTTLATYLPNTELALSFGIKNGEAVLKNMAIDYVFYAIER